MSVFDKKKNNNTVSFEDLIVNIDKNFNNLKKKTMHSQIQPNKAHKHPPLQH